MKLARASTAAAVVIASLAVCVGVTSGAAQAAGALPWRWSRVEANGTFPANREGHAAVALGERIYVIGGCLQEVRCYNDFHVFDTQTLRWSQEAVVGDPPEPRGGHSATAVGGNVIVFGGANSQGTFGDVYKLDLIKRRWSRVQTQGLQGLSSGIVGPGHRTGHAACTDDRGRIYVFGGYGADGSLLDDLWELSVELGNDVAAGVGDTAVATWSRPAAGGSPPLGRVGHTMTFVDGKLLVFGGYTQNGMTTNDAHAYDMESRRWTALIVPNPVPAPRQAHSAARHGKDIIIAGGCDVSTALPMCYSDVWSLNLGDMRWTQRSSDVISWFPRQGHTATFVRGRMFTFGGCDLGSACYGDVAALDTLDPCPSNCGGPGAGTCMGGAFCKCAMPLFAGHDCMQPLRCPSDCGTHGVCSGPGGTCTCENGWMGSSCSAELPCPSGRSPAYGTAAVGSITQSTYAKCSARGVCLTSGQCRCVAGFGGSACDEPALPGNNGGSGVPMSAPSSQPASQLAFIDPSIHRVIDPFRHHRYATEKRVEEKQPGIRDFGIDEVNPKGRSGNGAHCKDFCHFRGLCEDSVCYCQPGFYGKTCDQQEQSDAGTLSVLVGILISVASFLVSFLSMYLIQLYFIRQKKKAEVLDGYDF